MLGMRAILTLLSLTAVILSAEPPTAEISNGKIKARIYLPDAVDGFYKGTRFDWSGVIYQLEAEGHRFYGPWFTKRSDTVRDFIYEGDDIVVGPCSSSMGPAEDFRPLGYDAAKPGGTFIKIGIGVLRKADDKPYEGFRLYQIVDPGTWKVQKKADSIEFTHTVKDPATGYAYVYTKTLQLAKGKSELIMSHSLKNTGEKAIETTVYNHNFLVLDGKGPGVGTAVTFPFAVSTKRPPAAQLAALEGNSVVFKKDLVEKDTVFLPVDGFGAGVSDHEIRVENSVLKAGVAINGDQPLHSVNLWSIRSNVSVEPFVAVKAVPGSEFRWTNRYRYYTLP
jgi:hypothetical protein